jgi:hypothetical protein
MFIKNNQKIAEKIINKALNKTNKMIYKDKKWLGRVFIRDCFHNIKERENNIPLLDCCFECVDKETNKIQFFQYRIDFTSKKEMYKNIANELKNIFNKFTNGLEIIFQEQNGYMHKKNYRKIKLD